MSNHDNRGVVSYKSNWSSPRNVQTETPDPWWAEEETWRLQTIKNRENERGSLNHLFPRSSWRKWDQWQIRTPRDYWECSIMFHWDMIIGTNFSSIASLLTSQTTQTNTGGKVANVKDAFQQWLLTTAAAASDMLVSGGVLYPHSGYWTVGCFSFQITDWESLTVILVVVCISLSVDVWSVD